MSTFDGFIKEFPDIQVDYFRATHATAAHPPLACFLSHVHSDHLTGLDTLRSPFVYCSAATKALVLRLEKYPCRINFARGILEARKRTYRDLKHLLKPLPLETPTVIELAPGNRIQVTLLDTNHCPGSVMFLFENDRRAALYTGDTRCEPWFVDALARSPCLAEYTSGMRTLDTVYLDTTFIERDVVFQTKAEGLRELLQAVAKYPADTIFYFRAWTFGYEEVWTALSKALRSKVHIDEYKIGLYESLTVKDATRRFGAQFHLDPVAPGLVGFMCANAAHDGCLVADDDDGDGRGHSTDVRIHSCEKDAGDCPTVRNAPVVWIRPIVCRLPHGRGEVPEIGAGGGGEDLNKEAELEVASRDEIDRLCQLVDKNKSLSLEEKADLQAILTTSLENHGHIPIHMDLDADSLEVDEDDEQMGVKKIEDAVREMAAVHSQEKKNTHLTEASKDGELPRTITFPYSRHSSYLELCDLLDKLRPRDVWPCTVNPDRWFRSGELVTIRDLFGQYCTGTAFRHDVEVASRFSKRETRLEIQDSQATVDSEMYSEMSLPGVECELDDYQDVPLPVSGEGRSSTTNVALPYFYHSSSFRNSDGAREAEDAQDSQATAISELSRERRTGSHQAAVDNAVGVGEWVHISLASTTDNHTTPDVDLGLLLN